MLRPMFFILAAGTLAFWWFRPFRRQPAVSWCPPDDAFMSTVCPLQWELYQREGRHRTLYNLFDVPVNAGQDEIMAAYLGRLQPLFPGLSHCLDDVLREGVEGVEAAPISPPPACTSSKHAELERQLLHAYRAARILINPAERARYDNEVLSVMIRMSAAELEAEEKKRAGDAAGWERRSRMVKKMQVEVSEELARLCVGHLVDSALPSSSSS